MPTLDWDDYLKPPNISPAEHKAISAAAFDAQKENIGKLCRTLHPRSVLCLGAGYLNDIPIETLIAENTDIYLVEWIDGITEKSFRHDLMKQVEQRFICLICQCFRDPKKYCQNHRAEISRPSLFSRVPKQADNCDNFVRAYVGTGALCSNYSPAEFPRFLHADVTRGAAENFARQVDVILRKAKRPQHAFREAIHVSTHPRADTLLPLADHSMDFITSSMLASQFDFEPYTYFIRNLYLHFGRDSVEQNIDAINALAATLRNNLFLTQVDAHCQEISRLLKPDGRIYFSIEALHREEPSEHWFYAEIFSKAMEIVARHFLFDLETLPELIVPIRTEMVRGGASIVHSYLLLPKPH
jgi:SAM-dependent methyltransferase